MSNTELGTMRSFKKAEDGTIAIVFALTLFIVFMMTGLAIDVGRIMHAERKLAASVDGAALAAAKAMRDSVVTDQQAQDIATKYFNSNMAGTGGNYANVRALTIQIDRRNTSVAVDVEADVKTLFGGVAGIDKVSFPKSAVARYDSKDIEVGLQLDVTGSMRGRKLQDLKDALTSQTTGAEGLLEILLPNAGTTNTVRIGLAPYASGVNAGDYALDVSDRRAANGCVYERRNLADQTTDAAAVGAQSFKARSDLTGGGIGDCPRDAKVMAMTNQKGSLRDAINGWNTSTSTAGHLGTAWAWYLLSPEWAAIWPASARPTAYGDGRTMKVAILMTDGIYNTVGGRNNGDNGTTAAQSTRFALDTCAAMRAKGVIVYTIGFEAPADAKATLKACASDDTKFYDATDGQVLRLAFRNIASEINNLRLSR